MPTRLLERLRAILPTQAPPATPTAPTAPSQGNSNSPVVAAAARLPYYAPTLHQFYAFHWAEAAEKVFDYIAEALEHLKALLPADTLETLKNELNDKRGRSFRHDISFPYVRSAALYPATNQPDLYVAFFAYQEGPDMLLHFIWHLKKETSNDYFTQHLHQYLWTGPQREPQTTEIKGFLGESVLLSAVIQDNTLNQQSLATQLIHHYSDPESQVKAITLNCDGSATLYSQSQYPLSQKRSGAMLFYESRQSEDSRLANELVTIEWPLIVLYQLRIEHLYVKRYREQLSEAMRQKNIALQATLTQHFAPNSASQLARTDQLTPILKNNNLKQMERALTELSRPQYLQLERLNELEGYAQETEINLQNLTQRLERSPIFQQSHWQPLTYHAQHYHTQLTSDITSARHLAERASQAIQLLQTQTDIIGTASDRQLNWIIGITGTALAVGQLIDDNTAELLYYLFGIRLLWEALGLPPLTKENKTLILASVRLIMILTSILIAWLLLTIYLRQTRK